MNAEQIKAAAEQEVAEEDYRNKVNREKERIRLRSKHWFPWKISLKRREPPSEFSHLKQILNSHGWHLYHISDFTSRGMVHYAIRRKV